MQFREIHPWKDLTSWLRKIIKTRSLSAQAKKNYAFWTSNYPALPCITQSTSSVIGNEYFNNLVQSLASVFGVRYAFIGIVTGTLIKKIKTKNFHTYGTDKNSQFRIKNVLQSKEFSKFDIFVPTWSWTKFLVSSATYCSRSVHFRCF